MLKKEVCFLKKTMKIVIEKTGETIQKDFRGTAEELLAELEINPVTVIVAADRALIPLETVVSDAKEIQILTIVSGG